MQFSITVYMQDIICSTKYILLDYMYCICTCKCHNIPPWSSPSFMPGVDDRLMARGSASRIPGMIPASAQAWKSGETRFWMKDSWTAGSFSGVLRSMKIVGGSPRVVSSSLCEEREATLAHFIPYLGLSIYA